MCIVMVLLNIFDIITTGFRTDVNRSLFLYMLVILFIVNFFGYIIKRFDKILDSQEN